MIFGAFYLYPQLSSFGQLHFELSKKIELSILYNLSVILNFVATYIHGRKIKIITIKLKAFAALGREIIRP
jgi:hypothetical protein